MSNLSQIEDAVNEVKKTQNPNLALLHCNSSYPASISEMNLAVIKKLQNIFNLPVGFLEACPCAGTAPLFRFALSNVIN